MRMKVFSYNIIQFCLIQILHITVATPMKFILLVALLLWLGSMHPSSATQRNLQQDDDDEIEEEEQQEFEGVQKSSEDDEEQDQDEQTDNNDDEQEEEEEEEEGEGQSQGVVEEFQQEQQIQGSVNQIDSFDQDISDFQIDENQQLEQEEDFEFEGPYDYLLEDIDEGDEEASQQLFQKLQQLVSGGSKIATRLQKDEQQEQTQNKLFYTLFGEEQDKGFLGYRGLSQIFSPEKYQTVQKIARSYFGDLFESIENA